MINDVAEAVMTKYNSAAGNTLRGLVPGGLWFSEAKPSVDYPYAVFTWDGSVIDEIAGDRTNGIEHAAITVSVFSKDDDGGTQIFNIIEEWIEVFDWTVLTYPVGSEYSHLAVQRLSAANRSKIDNVWSIDLQYDIQYQH